MKIHLIVDYQYLYYRYKFAVERGVVPNLTSQADFFWGIEGINAGEVFDVSELYYSLKDIEGFRKKFADEHEVTLSICFDSKSKRKEESSDYKSNRHSSLVDLDRAKISLAKQILTSAGYNTYQLDGCEADDLVYTLVQKHKDDFDITYIYTPDLDLCVNISSDNKVVLQRYKWNKGYQLINAANFSSLMLSELKCNIPFNCILLYKATVGDKSDNIPGIKGFGPKAFNTLLQNFPLDSRGYENMVNPENVRGYILNYLSRLHSEDKVKSALDSLQLVSPLQVDDLSGLIVSGDTQDKRVEIYTKIGMPSLAK